MATSRSPWWIPATSLGEPLITPSTKNWSKPSPPLDPDAASFAPESEALASTRLAYSSRVPRLRPTPLTSYLARRENSFGERKRV